MDIPLNCRQRVLVQLSGLGIDDMSILPDMEGVRRKILRETLDVARLHSRMHANRTEEGS